MSNEATVTHDPLWMKALCHDYQPCGYHACDRCTRCGHDALEHVRSESAYFRPLVNKTKKD